MPSGAVADHPNPFLFWQLSKGLKTAIWSTLSLLFPRRTSWILSPALCIVRCWSSSLPCKGFSGQASVCRDKASHIFQCRNWVVNHLSRKPEKGINRQNHQRICFPKDRWTVQDTPRLYWAPDVLIKSFITCDCTKWEGCPASIIISPTPLPFPTPSLCAPMKTRG